MNNLEIGDIVENSINQHSIVCWKGSIEELGVIGLESLRVQLPGYTDGTCSLDNQRYFQCEDGHGYYVLQNKFFDTHRIIEKKKDSKKLTTSIENFDSDRQTTASSQPIPSKFSPSVTQKYANNNDNCGTSSSRGVLSRLASKQQSQNSQLPTSLSTEQTSSIETNPQASRVYQPDNYRSVSCDQTRRSIVSVPSFNEDNKTSPLYNQIPSSPDTPSLERDHNLDGWTFTRLNDFMGKQIPNDNRFCLNIYDDDCNVNYLIDKQINDCGSIQPKQPLDDIQIELIKLYNHVDVIFPSRIIHLYENSYLLLAIICSNNQCAYIRTSNGWAYTDTECDNKQAIIVDEISQMIDHSNKDLLNHSEQCRHLTKNASFLYYKRI